MPVVARGGRNSLNLQRCLSFEGVGKEDGILVKQLAAVRNG